jgi:hypothetical protein
MKMENLSVLFAFISLAYVLGGFIYLAGRETEKVKRGPETQKKALICFIIAFILMAISRFLAFPS